MTPVYAVIGWLGLLVLAYLGARVGFSTTRQIIMSSEKGARPAGRFVLYLLLFIVAVVAAFVLVKWSPFDITIKMR